MNRQKTYFTIVCLCILLITASCAAAAPKQEVSSDYYVQDAPAMVAPAAPAEESGSVAYSESDINNAIPQSGTDRIVIKNANISIVVDDPAAAMSLITQMAETQAGFVVTSNFYKVTSNQGVELPQASITIRVPSDKLTDTMNNIKKLVNDPAKDIPSENVSGQDITQEYTDLQSRKTNLEAAVKKLNTFLEEAETTEDALNVYSQLMQVNEQLEVLKGQIKYYDESSQYSSIAVSIIAQASVEPLTVGGWQPAGVAKDAIQALINTLKVLANIAIWLILFFLPIIIVFAIPVVIVVLLVRRGTQKRKAKKQATEPPASTPGTPEA